MKLFELKPKLGSRKEPKRIGCGYAASGKYAGRGMSGQNSRTGDGTRPGFEGGQTPLTRRLPKLGGIPNAPYRKYTVVNLSVLDKHFNANDEVTPEILLKKRIIKKLEWGLKILGDGEITKPLVVKAHAFSSTAKEKIEKAGGKAEVIE
ncbi:MAG: 50S ribosomal protein L15 [Dictyoglomus sp. NZ13-RE01]|nr:MAG: 50S ribosomal protein L15 [Dictyoglomus sp. NZ13-RE01]